MGCADCTNTNKELNQQFAIVQAAAKELAVKSNCNVFIYKTEEGWSYMVEEAAREIGIHPTGGIVSRFIPSSS